MCAIFSPAFVNICVCVFFVLCFSECDIDSDSDDDHDKEVNRPDAVSLDELSNNGNEGLYECYPNWLFQMPLIGDYLCVTI